MKFMVILLSLLAMFGLAAAQEPTTLNFDTDAGTLEVTPLSHASARLELAGAVIQVDPWSDVTDYARQPDADWVWVTHQHGDHLDPGTSTQAPSLRSPPPRRTT